MTDFAGLRAAFFDRWRDAHPDEAGTLGIVDPVGRLCDPSREAIEDEARALGAMLRALEPCPVDGEARLDAWMITSWARHEVRRVARGAHLANVELGLLPYHLLRHHLVHAEDETARAVAASRIRAIPAFLAAHERTLAAGIAEGVRAHAGTVQWIAERSLPAIARALDDLGAPDAARAYEAHARFLNDRVRPSARTSGAIGAEETRARLGDMALSLETSLAEAHVELERAHDGLVRAAARVPELDGARDVAAVRAAMQPLYARSIASRDDDVIPAYEALVTRASAFARAHGLVPFDDALAVRVGVLPPAIAEAGHAQNWAAPLVAPQPRADFLVARDARVHPAMAAPLLAVHEAVPGHALQSLAFARAHGRDPRPVRFLAIADDVAMARSYFGAMLSIEGWATWVEHRMLELGFYEGLATVYAWNVRAIRAARVIVDLGIHGETMSIAEARSFLNDRALLPDSIATREVARYQRIPLQALTYLTGALAIERHLAPHRARGDETRAIAALLAAGPVPPALL
ncbi:DUF885 family protein [Sandaracinus amylolyticus]|uniref:DUF885 domain-containing protein n=1 Tax=Sandaracinus amylolyticus TaxID=927083 RepID=A0A0F6W0A0_9BACT|nr:DUF885 family protein [Sandaracinus amylolyticus]AKF03990.1 hypothetical protein DB32_001139 [Sandaracinus amylolyticus]